MSRSIQAAIEIVRTTLRLLAFGVVWLLPAASRTEEAVGVFDASNKLYEQGKYVEAAEGYQQVVKAGHASPALYYNLGNAWLKAGKLGRAVNAYLNAEKLSPRDPDLVANLRFARSQVQGPTLATGRFEQWLGRLSLNEWTMLTCVAGWLLLVSLTVPYLRPSLRVSLRGWSIALALGMILAGTFLLLDYQRLVLQPTAIVVNASASIHQAPLTESPTTFTLNDGAEVRVLDHKDQWLQVTTGPNRIGWVKRDDLALPSNS